MTLSMDTKQPSLNPRSPSSSKIRRQSSRLGPLSLDDPVDSKPSHPRSRRSAKSSGRSSKPKRAASDAKPSSPSESMNFRSSGLFEGRQRGGSATSDEYNADSLTKTGRVSRALKGKPVHKCNICDKVYTRNEHLRRHQLNHSNVQLRCDVPWCKKEFHRADLLARHKEEHNNSSMASPNDFSTSHDDASVPSARPRGAAGGSLSSDAPSRNSFAAARGLSIGSAGQHTPFGTAVGPLMMSDAGPYASSSVLSSPEFYSAASTDIFDPTMAYNVPFDLPTPEPFPQSTVVGPTTWMGTTTDTSGSKSPVSAISSAAMHQWSASLEPVRFNRVFSPTDSDVSGYNPYGTPNFGNVYEAGPLPIFGAAFFAEQDAMEEEFILNSLTGLHKVPQFTRTRGGFTMVDDRYLESFWHTFHPMFSVIHRPTFDAVGASPIVRALIIAIGAHFLEGEEAQNVACCLRESCNKLMQRRTNLDYGHSRLWDLQAVFLQEVSSVYISRRPSNRFSQRFEELIAGLHADQDTLFFSRPTDSLCKQPFDDINNNAHIQWVHLESKRRLLLACHILEVQQNSFFGQHRPVSDRNLPVPCSMSLWETYDNATRQTLAEQEPLEACSLTDALALPYYRNVCLFDSFLSNVAIAHLTHSSSQMSEMQPPSFSQGVQQTRRCLFSYEAAMLAASTPVYDLLAVSGESFVLGQKLATQDQFTQAMADLQAWVSDVRSQPALHHAVQLLRLSLQHGRIGVMQEEWALTLAALVCWACLMWPRQKEGMLGPMGESDVVQQAVTAVQRANSALDPAWQQGAVMDRAGTRACLAYVRQRIEGRIGWLVQDAKGVLGKLVDGRVIEDVESQ